MNDDNSQTGWSTKGIIAYNTVSQIFGKIVTAGSTFLISILLARSYGPVGYGDFTKITTFVAVFYLFSDFGLNAIYLQLDKELNAKKRDAPLWPMLFALRTAFSILLMFITITLLAFLPATGSGGYTTAVKIGIILFSPTIFFQALITSANAVFQGKLRYDLAAVATTAGSVISLVLIWIGTKLFLPSIATTVAVISLTLGAMASGITSLILSRQYVHVSFVWDWAKIRELVTRALPLGLTLLCNVIYFRIDSFILTLTRSTAEVGLYGFAYKLFEFPLVIPTFFMNAVYPTLLRTLNQESGLVGETFRKKVTKSLVVLIVGSLLTVCIMWVGAPLVGLVRNEFEGSILPLRILTLGLPFFFITSLSMWALIALKKQHILFLIYACSMIGNIAANILFIPTYGYLAAAWVTVGSEAAVLLISGFVLWKAMHDSDKKYVSEL